MKNIYPFGMYLENFVARKPEKEVISMGISADTLQILDRKADAAGISRNELINTIRIE